MRHDPAAIIQAAKDAGADIDAPVMKIEEGEDIGTYVLLLYNGKRVEWTPVVSHPQDAAAGGGDAPPEMPPARRPNRNT